MARPKKNNCDYFTHDNNLRNHIKIKAIRSKFPNGYAIWVMFLEHLTSCDGNVFEFSDLQLELLSGDFGFSVAEIRGVLDYGIKLEMIFNKNGFINSESLDERLASVYIKRGLSKQQSAKQKRINGKFVANNTDSTVVSVTETPQSKVNKSKVNKSKVFNAKGFLLELLIDEQIAIDFLKNRKIKRLANTETAFKNIASEIMKTKLSANDCIKVAVEKGWGGFKANWLNNIDNNGKNQQSNSKSQGATLEQIAAIAEATFGDLPD